MSLAGFGFSARSMRSRRPSKICVILSLFFADASTNVHFHSAASCSPASLATWLKGTVLNQHKKRRQRKAYRWFTRSDLLPTSTMGTQSVPVQSRIFSRITLQFSKDDLSVIEYTST